MKNVQETIFADEGVEFSVTKIRRDADKAKYSCRRNFAAKSVESLPCHCLCMNREKTDKFVMFRSAIRHGRHGILIGLRHFYPKCAVFPCEKTDLAALPLLYLIQERK